MEYNQEDLDKIEEILKQNDKLYKKYRVMALAGYGLAAIGVLLGAEWIAGTTAAVGDTILEAEKDTLLGGAFFAGLGIGSGVLLSRKDRMVNKMTKLLERVKTGFSITKKWGFKPRIARRVKRVQQLDERERTKADVKWSKMLEKFKKLKLISENNLRDINYDGGSHNKGKIAWPDFEKEMKKFEAPEDDKKMNGSIKIKLVSSYSSNVSLESESMFDTKSAPQKYQEHLLKNAEKLCDWHYPLNYSVELYDEDGNVVKDANVSKKFKNSEEVSQYLKEISNQSVNYEEAIGSPSENGSENQQGENFRGF